MNRLLVLDPSVTEELIDRRRRLGLDRYDEVWDGVYVMSPLASNAHQDLVQDLGSILQVVVREPGLGRVHQGANVSDRHAAWESNFRIPDIVVVLNGGRAIDRGTHWQGGPDFLIEVVSPGDETDEKLPFYATLGVREVLVIHRDKRTLTLFRHSGSDLVAAKTTTLGGKRVLRSDVLPLAFRRSVVRKQGPRTVVVRTDGQAGEWTI